jgi:hypothetical protein
MIEHSERLQHLVNDALDKGAEIAGRGSFGNLGEDAVDQFFPPTVLVNVDHTMKIMQEEVCWNQNACMISFKSNDVKPYTCYLLANRHLDQFYQS